MPTGTALTSSTGLVPSAVQSCYTFVMIAYSGRLDVLTCSICGAEDYRILDGFDADMQPIYSHHIKFDPYLLPDGRQYLTPEEKAQGWQFKMLDGKPVKYRLLCGDCLVRQEDTRHTRKEMKDELAREAERRSLQHSFYSRFLQLD